MSFAEEIKHAVGSCWMRGLPKYFSQVDLQAELFCKLKIPRGWDLTTEYTIEANRRIDLVLFKKKEVDFRKNSRKGTPSEVYLKSIEYAIEIEWNWNKTKEYVKERLRINKKRFKDRYKIEIGKSEWLDMKIKNRIIVFIDYANSLSKKEEKREGEELGDIHLLYIRAKKK